MKGGRDHTAKARNARIVELEADFEQLPFFKGDGWGAFIKRGWSLVLARRFPDKLDLHYSAEKVAQNLSAALDGCNGRSATADEVTKYRTVGAKTHSLSLTDWMPATGVQLLLRAERGTMRWHIIAAVLACVLFPVFHDEWG